LSPFRKYRRASAGTDILVCRERLVFSAEKIVCSTVVKNAGQADVGKRTPSCSAS
jgi:hypothetical protein